MKIAPPVQRPRRRANFTPMIDVVFLLLVFFMMISRFGGIEGLGLGLATAGAAQGWSGPPRLVEVGRQDIALNGRPMPLEDLAPALAALMSGPDQPVVLRATDEASLQRLVGVMQALGAVGMTQLLLAE